MREHIRDIVEKITKANATEDVLWSVYHDLKEGALESPMEKKLLAEISFLLARHYKRKRDFQKAEQLAHESVGLYEELNINTLADAAPILFVFLPDIMHENIIREEFKRSAA